MTCQICGVITEGSIGPATGYLRPICQPCADLVDGELLQQCIQQSRVMDQVLSVLNPPHVLEVETVQ